MIRRTTVNLTEETDKQIKALKSFGSFTDIVRIAIDRMYIQEKGKPTVYALIDDKYASDPGLYTKEEFEQMNQALWGQTPELNGPYGAQDEDGNEYEYYTDAAGDKVLTTKPEDLEIARRYS